MTRRSPQKTNGFEMKSLTVTAAQVPTNGVCAFGNEGEKEKRVGESAERGKQSESGKLLGRSERTRLNGKKELIEKKTRIHFEKGCGDYGCRDPKRKPNCGQLC